MTNAFMPIDNGSLSTGQREHIPFRTYADAAAASNTYREINMRMLGSGTFGKQLAFFHRIPSPLPLSPQIQEIHAQWKQ
jgi:hypothetical protein